MSATAQPDGKGADGNVPAGKTPEPKDDKVVPLGEFIELRQQLKAMSEELTALKTAKAPVKTEPEPPKPPLSETEQIGQKLRDIEKRERIRDLVGELGLADQKQGQAVYDILSKNADLAPPEALELAAKRNQELFKERAGSGFDKNVHGSLRPTPGNQPPEPKPSEHKQRLEYAKKLSAAGHRDAAEEVAIDMIGAAAAKVIGWDYKPKPIPQ